MRNSFEHLPSFDITRLSPQKEVKKNDSQNSEEPVQAEAEPKERKSYKEIIRRGSTALPFDHALAQKTQEHRRFIELEKKKEIINFLKSGKIDEIIKFMRGDSLENGTLDNKIFEKEIERLKNECSNSKETSSELYALSKATSLEQKEWRILTAFEIFHKETFLHCARTYEKAISKLRRLEKLRNEILDGGVTMIEFSRACLMHDLGKFAIPEFILNSKFSDQVWTNIFMEMPEDQQDEILVKNNLAIPDQDRKDFEKVQSFFDEHEYRAVFDVPIGSAFNTPPQIKAMHERGINTKLPLMSVMIPHEKQSQYMLKKLGYRTESILAGNHHNYDNQEKIEDPIATSALQALVLADMIHTLDVFDALKNGRSYLDKKTLTEALDSVVHQAKANKIKTKWVAASIINDELKEMIENDPKQVSTNSEDYEEIKKFIDLYLPQEETSFFQEYSHLFENQFEFQQAA